MNSQAAAFQCCDLLVLVLMTRHDRAFFQRQPSHGDAVAMDGLPCKQRIQNFDRDLAPAVQFHRAGIVS